MIEILERINKHYEAKEARRIKGAKISRSLKNFYATKRAEAGFHRVRYSEMGKYVGYYLLPDLK